MNTTAYQISEPGSVEELLDELADKTAKLMANARLGVLTLDECKERIIELWGGVIRLREDE